METIIKPGYEKILALFYNDQRASIHLRDISRKAGLNENSASRFLKQLEKQAVLRSAKEANLKKYSLRKNDRTYAILSFFDVERLNRLPSIRKNAILCFLRELPQKPVFCVLFGSTAKNNFTAESDIDLLLVVNERINTKRAEEHADAQTAIRISPMQIEGNEFKEELKLKQDKVVQSALATGYPVTNHIEFYRMVLDEGI